MRTPNDLVYGETNRYPLFVNSAEGCIRYWLKLTRMEASKLPSKAYRMLHVLEERGKRIWASNVRCKLYQYGFGFVWLNEGVEEMNQFLHVFRERLIQFVDGKSGIPMLRLAINLMFMGHFAPFMR